MTVVLFDAFYNATQNPCSAGNTTLLFLLQEFHPVFNIDLNYLRHNIHC